MTVPLACRGVKCAAAAAWEEIAEGYQTDQYMPICQGHEYSAAIKNGASRYHDIPSTKT